jgi:hypothetical protein
VGERAGHQMLADLLVSISAYVSKSAYVSIRQHTSAYVSIRQDTSGYVRIREWGRPDAR